MSDAKTMYKVVVSGVSFTLSQASIRSDSPNTNLLAMSLLGDFAEAEKRTLVLDRNATTFKLIKDHLTGYTVLPIDDTDEHGMSAARMLRYLRDDCDYYGLKRLGELVDKEVKKMEGSIVQSALQPDMNQRDGKDTAKLPGIEMYIQAHMLLVEAAKFQLECDKEHYDRSQSLFASGLKHTSQRKLTDATSALHKLLLERETATVR